MNGRRPLLAVLGASALAGAVLVVAIGNGPGASPNAYPNPGSQTSALPPAGPVHAELQVHAQQLEWPCSPGGCEAFVELRGAGGAWTGSIANPELGLPVAIDGVLPPLLSDGAWTLRTDVHVFGDVIYPGENTPRDYGVAGSCTTDFTIEPETTVAVVTLDFRGSDCTAGTTVAADPSVLTSMVLLPQFDEGCGADVGGCDYLATLTGPGGTWHSILRTVRPPSQRRTNDLVSWLVPGAYRLEAASHRMDLEREAGAGFQKDLGALAQCSVAFVVPDGATSLEVFLAFAGATCTMTTELRVLPISTGPVGPVGPVATPAAS